MKVSELIQDIINTVDEKFGYSDHINDCPAVSITPNGDGTWVVCLERPTQRGLDSGQVPHNLCHTIKVWEMRYAFWTEADTLVQALLALQDKVEAAEEYDFIAC